MRKSWIQAIAAIAITIGFAADSFAQLTEEQLDNVWKRGVEHWEYFKKKSPELAENAEREKNPILFQWCYPPLNMLGATEEIDNPIGWLVHPDYFLINEKYPPGIWLLFHGIYGGKNDSSLFTFDYDRQRYLVVNGFSNRSLTSQQVYLCTGPVIRIEPTDPERYAQYRMLTKKEMDQLKAFLEKKRGAKIELDIPIKMQHDIIKWRKP